MRQWSFVTARSIPGEFVLTACFVLAVAVESEEAGVSEFPAGFDSEAIQRLNDHRYRIGDVTVDGEVGEVHIPAAVNQDEGLIELIACGAEGKRHESVLVTHIRPMHLQVALLLLGLEQGTPVAHVGDSVPPTGERVKIEFEWDGAGDGRFPIEHLVRRIDTGRAMSPQPWIFVGSRVENGMFVADLDQSLITTYRDPATILDNGQPEGANDELFEVNTEAIRPLGATGLIIISRYAEP